MYPAHLRETLRATLEQHPAPEPEPGERLAAVLAPLVATPEPSVVFTLRSAELSRHAGEISFPGGLQDPGESLMETALREAEEEIGLDRELPDVLGALPEVRILVSSTLVVPFVAMLDAAPPLHPGDGEIAEVLTFPFDRLTAAERVVELDRGDGRVWRGWAYEVDGHTIWGATGGMLHTLLDRIREAVA